MSATEIKNRKSNDFEITETLEAGIILVGREVKAIARKEADLSGSYCIVKDAVLLVGSYVKLEEDNFSVRYEPNRDRTLLLRKSEFRYLKEQLKKGFIAVPIKLYLKRSKYKVLIGIGRPLKKFDKREKEKEKQVKREMHED